MSVINQYLKEYKKNQVETATPEQILILLYDGAIQFLNKAKVALEQSEFDEFQLNLLRCEKIIIEFMNSLDMNRGGKVAETLYSLYSYYNKTLVEAGIGKNVTKIDEILHHLNGLRETWQKAIELASAERNATLGNTKNSYVDKYSSKEEDDDDNDDDDDDDDDDE